MPGDFFKSDKTPWGDKGEIVVWAVGMVVSAFFINALITTYKKKKGK